LVQTEYVGNSLKFLTFLAFISALIIGGSFLLRNQLPTQRKTTPTATEISTPSAKYGDVTLEVKIESTTSGKIKGTLNITNASVKSLVDLYYTVTLKSPEIQTTKIVDNKEQTVYTQPLISFNQSNDSFKLNPSGDITLPFEVNYTPHLKNGTYTVAATITNNLGETIASIPLNLNLTGTGDLIISNPGSCKLVSSKEYDPTVAGLVEKDAQLQGKCSFTNPTNQPVNVKYTLKYSILHVLSYPKVEKLDLNPTEQITFAPNETKEISFALPTNLDPQVYEAFITLIDNSGKTLSPVNVFRWTIGGQSGRVEKISLDKDYYGSGQTAKVATSVSPSLDLYWSRKDNPIGTKLTNPSLLVSISSKNNACGQATLPLPDDFVSSSEFTVDVPINKACQDPEVEVKLLSNDKEVTHGNIKVVSGSSPDQKPINKLIFLVIPVLLALILVIILLAKKSKKNLPPKGTVLTILLITLSYLFLGNINSAGAVAVNSPGPLKGFVSFEDGEGIRKDQHYTVYFYGSADWSGSVATVRIWGTRTREGGCDNPRNWILLDGPGLSTTRWVEISGLDNWETTVSYNSGSGPVSLVYNFTFHADADFGDRCNSNDNCNIYGPQYGVITLNSPTCTSVGGTCANGNQLTAGGQFCSTRQASYDIGCAGSYPYCYSGCGAGLTASCTASPAYSSINQNVTWTGAPSGSYTGTPSYSWSGTAITGATNTANPGNTASFTKQYSTDGARSASVTVTAGGQTATNSCSVTVSSAFIQTTGGDVHSNTDINTPGGQ
jgi:hypothetical protein